MKNDQQAPKPCKGCAHWKEVKRRVRIAEMLKQAIGAIETRLENKELKPTMGDYLKLLQMEQDFEEEGPREIKVTWVGPEGSSSGK